MNQVTILVYTFPKVGAETPAFLRIVAALERTWKLTGRIKTVVVASHRFAALEGFLAQNPDVELQIEPSLVFGDIKTMSLDCIRSLHKRFSTSYVLIVQDDGFPIRSGLEKFLGKYDFVGAPIICDGWKRKLCYAFGFGSFNGGFSLRSHRYCEYAARKWGNFFSHFIPEEGFRLGEDVYYTTLLKLLPETHFRFKFPSEREAFEFAYDSLGGKVALPAGVEPFGLHGAVAREYLANGGDAK